MFFIIISIFLSSYVELIDRTRNAKFGLLNKEKGYLVRTGTQVSKYILISYLYKFPLFSYKLVYYKIWCKIIKLIENKEHLTTTGLFKIVSLKALFKLGLNDNLREAFPNFLKE